jgi:hypothetical protein
MAQEQELLKQLIQAADLNTATNAVRELERHFLYTWRPVSDNEANYGLINIGSDPGNALIERVTNAIDGVIEREALRQQGKKGGVVPASPREAVEALVPSSRGQSGQSRRSRQTTAASRQRRRDAVGGRPQATAISHDPRSWGGAHAGDYPDNHPEPKWNEQDR